MSGISFTGRNSTTSSSGAGSFTVEDAIDTANTDVLALAHITTAATFGAAGMSVGMRMDLEDDAGNLDECVRMRGEWTDATSGSEDSDIVFEYRRAGAALAGYTRFSPLTGFAMTVDGVGTGTTFGAALYNSTAAAALAQQYSPMLVLSGNGYATGPAVSMNVRWALRGRPVQGAAAPTGQLDFMSSINAAAYTTGFSLTSGGAGTFTYPGTQLDAARNIVLTIDNDASQAPLAGQANQQVSGGLRFRGFGYNSVSTAIESSDFLIQCRPLTANPATAVLGLYYSNSGAAYGGYVLSIDSSGSVSCNTVSATSYDASSSDVLRGNFVGTSNVRSTGGALSLRGALAAGDANSDLVFRTTNTRTAGYTAEWQNNTTRIGSMSWDGQFTAVSVASAFGANVASANDLLLLRDGDAFHVTGVTDIRGLPGSTHATVPRQSGSTVWLIFDGACTVKHNTAPSATWAKILLAGSVDLLTAADTRLELKYDGTSWYEISRTVA